MRIWPGQPYPLGASWDGMGVNFALFSEHADKVELCLFESIHATNETQRVLLEEYTDLVFHVYLPDARPGQLYGYRVYGSYDPTLGHRFNPHKILVDPYAKAIVRPPKQHDTHFGYILGSKDADLSFDTQDNAAHAPLCVVVDSAFTWGDDRPPRTPWHKTIIYETHVKGMTMTHPKVPEALRGTYAGLANEAVISHLLDLGVTAIELMPVHQKVDEFHLAQKGLTNYWGYNTLSYFAPDIRYTSHQGLLAHVREFKTMVRTFHSAGLEVILDVVYNHTGEGNHLGPTLSFRGIDNVSYYRLMTQEARFYVDFTGCGNTLNMQHPRVLQLIMDSLRYWIQEMHIDGFRFDLASALARELHEVNQLGAFFDIIHQDPVISQVKLIAEPWDIGEGGYQVGNFPVLWTEWNGKYRDAIRSFWKGDPGQLGEVATRITGSSDLYQRSGRSPYASINFITCHDGFCLEDLVSYEQKHNEANGEQNKDGENDNRSWNCGIEGATEDPQILALRNRYKRSLMATLLLSAGVPMISGGDEIGRTQLGNNNAYCHDSKLTWYNWMVTKAQSSTKKHMQSDSIQWISPQQDFFKFVRKVISIRKRQPVFQRREFFTGNTGPVSGIKDILWFEPSGKEMTELDWKKSDSQVLGMLLAGNAMRERDERGENITGDSLLLLLNANAQEQQFILPAYPLGDYWELLLDTSSDCLDDTLGNFVFHQPFLIVSYSLCLFRCAIPSAATV